MNTPNESTDPLRPAYPEAAGGAQTEEPSTRGRESRRNLALLAIVGIVLLLVVFFLGREPEQPTDEPAPSPTTVE